MLKAYWKLQVLRFWVIFCLLLIGCSGNGAGEDHDEVQPLFGARVITAETSTQDLFNPELEGSAATGRIGDIVMANSRVRLVIQAPGRDVGLGPHGGTIIDAGLVGENPEIHLGRELKLV